MRKPVRINITCGCGAYPFPHRLSGGRCSGSEWAEEYKRLDGELCTTCVNNKDNCYSCDVSTGSESINECEGTQYYNNTGWVLLSYEETLKRRGR